MAFPVLDMHCDTADRIAWPSLDPLFYQRAGHAQFNPDDPAAAEDTALDDNGCHLSLNKMGDIPWAQCFACFIYDEFSPEESIAFYRHVMGHLDDEIRAHADRIAQARTVADIRPRLESGGHVAVRTIENARLFAADPDLVGALADEGVLMASLSWNARGPLNDTCFADVLRLTTRPFVASHSNSRAVCGHPRNLTDAQFAEIRDRGGVVGLNYCPDFLRDDASSVEPTFDDLCRHVEHWLDLDGENSIALGSDFDGTDLPSCISSAAKTPELQAVFAERFGEDITRKLCYENALSFFERWGR